MISLKDAIQVELDKSRELVLNFPWENKKAYANWLAQTYYMVNHSTRLVALAGAYANFNRNDLHARFVDHAKEERGHQMICVADLKSLGFRLQDFPCLCPSAAMYQVQYYWIQHRDACAFFGYTFALECLSLEFGPEIWKRASRAFGEGAANFLKVHAEADVDHVEKAFKYLDTFSAPERELILENMALSTDLYRAMLKEVQSQVGPSALKIAA